MYWFFAVGVKNSVDIMVEATAVNIIEFTCLERCHSTSGDVFLMGMIPGVTANLSLFVVRTFLQVLVPS